MGETHGLSQQPLVMLAVPLLDEAARLPGLLAAILAQDYPRQRMRVVLVDGGSRDGTRELALEVSRRYTFFQVLENRRRVAAAGLNCALGLVESTGDDAEDMILLRLDARTRPAPDYVSACVRAFGAAADLAGGEWRRASGGGRVAGVGGPQVAAGASAAGCIHALALNHPFGVGGPAYRRAVQPTLSDTVYLGAYPVLWLQRAGGWDETFAYNEDYELNTRLREAGGQLLVDPAIHVNYLARDSLGSLAAQYFHYGRWRTLTIRRHGVIAGASGGAMAGFGDQTPTGASGGALRWRHLAPALLAALLITALAAAPWTLWPLALLAGAYAGLDLAASLQIVLSRTPAALYPMPEQASGTMLTALETPPLHPQSVHFGPRALPRLLFVFPLLHLSWGVGFWLGVMRQPRL